MSAATKICERCEDADSDEKTVVYVAGDGSQMRLHPSCYADMRDGDNCADDDEDLEAHPLAEGASS